MWKRRAAKSTPKPTASPSTGTGDPMAPHAAKHLAFLEQARWLLEQQQRRAATFQQTSVALVGFDGVLLALLLSNDTLGTFVRYSAAWWAGTIAALLFALSALIGVLVLVPFGMYSVPADTTISHWAKQLVTPDWDRSTQHFAHMLLVEAPPERGADSRPARFRRWWRARLHMKPLPMQPLRSAERLATRRGRLTTTSAFTLLGGIIALVVVLVTSPVTAGVSEDAPTSEPSDTQSQISQSSR